MAGQVSCFPNLRVVKHDDEFIRELKKFNSKNADGFLFGKGQMKERYDFCESLLDKVNMILKDNTKLELLKECLTSLVVMSRDHMSMKERFVAEETWKNLITLAELIEKDVTTLSENINRDNSVIIISACKILCNIVFITKDSKGYCSNDKFINALVLRVKKAKQFQDQELEFLNLRLVFLVSVMNDKAKTKILENYDGRRVLIDFILAKLEKCLKCKPQTALARCYLSPVDVKSCCETLKILFNLNIKSRREVGHIFEERTLLEFHDIAELTRKSLLLQSIDDPYMTEKLHTDAGNCLYSVPPSCFSEEHFIPLLSNKGSDGVFCYAGSGAPTTEKRDLSPVTVILKSVESKIKQGNLSTESLQPVLSLLSQLSRASRCIRKYCKEYIIPPRKNFEDRPEVGAELRNKLIKLFTNANTEVKGAAADFVFVMCKEKVDRLVKYTGYGNAAGLLASRGLLAGGQGDTVYSDTDSDSDTEEYLENIEKINPVTGHIPPDMPNPMEGMSDEQKEYLAVQLANQIAKLSNDEVIKPVCVDPVTGNLVSFQEKVHQTVLPDKKESDDSDSD